MKPARSPRSPRLDAFTFVEVFAAMVFLAILVPAIVEGLSIANRASLVAERGGIAGELAENKMNEILVATTGTNNNNTGESASNTGGNFGTDWPGYRWEMTQQTWDQDSLNTMTELSVEVFYPLQGKERSVKLTTLVSGTTTIQAPI